MSRKKKFFLVLAIVVTLIWARPITSFYLAYREGHDQDSWYNMSIGLGEDCVMVGGLYGFTAVDEFAYRLGQYVTFTDRGLQPRIHSKVVRFNLSILDQITAYCLPAPIKGAMPV